MHPWIRLPDHMGCCPILMLFVSNTQPSYSNRLCVKFELTNSSYSNLPSWLSPHQHWTCPASSLVLIFRCQGCRAPVSTPSGPGRLLSKGALCVTAGSLAGCSAVERSCLQTSVLKLPLVNINNNNGNLYSAHGAFTYKTSY